MSLLISGATIIDCVGQRPTEGNSIWIEGNRIKAIARREDFPARFDGKVIDAQGKYAIPGLMNANVHLLGDCKRVEVILRYWNRYEDLATEAAQLALKNGVTTVFDTNGMRKPLQATRDRINRGEIPGSRIFCAGWIVGFDGPWSKDYFPKTLDAVSSDLGLRVNSMCVENVGPALMYMSPQEVAEQIRMYLAKGVDFIKYASNDHVGPLLQFSERVQRAIVEEAHRAGTTAQAHTMAIEGLRVAIEAGCDLMAHANITAHYPIPDETLELLVKKNVGASVMAFTERRTKFIMSQGGEMGSFNRVFFKNCDINARNLIRADALIMLMTDGSIRGPEILGDPKLKNSWLVPGEDNIGDLRDGHFVWFKGMAEKGCPPMKMLQAATRNIAIAYGKGADLGTLEAGKIADIVVLDRNPLESHENYRSIHMILKDGAVVDRDALPTEVFLSKPLEPLPEDAEEYRHFATQLFQFPPCC